MCVSSEIAYSLLFLFYVTGLENSDKLSCSLSESFIWQPMWWLVPSKMRIWLGPAAVWEKVGLGQHHKSCARNLSWGSSLTDSVVTKVLLYFPLSYASFYRITLGNFWKKRGGGMIDKCGAFLGYNTTKYYQSMLSTLNFWAQSQKAGKWTNAISIWELKVRIERSEQCRVSRLWAPLSVTKRRSSFWS